MKPAKALLIAVLIAVVYLLHQDSWNWKRVDPLIFGFLPIGLAYRQGIGIYGLMASSSCLVIPLTIFFIGTRLWALGKKFGHQTQVAFFRDRWECSTIGTLIFILSVVMLVPYMIISIMGGGRVLSDISGGRIAYSLGCAVVALVVTVNVFFGGMRGTVWVN